MVAEPHDSNCSPRCPSPSRRSITASATPPPTDAVPSPMNNYTSRRSMVVVTHSNNNNHRQAGIAQSAAKSSSQAAVIDTLRLGQASRADDAVTCVLTSTAQSQKSARRRIL